MERIGIIGSGAVAQTVAARLSELGHAVSISTRNPEALQAKTDANPQTGLTFSDWHAANPSVEIRKHSDAAEGADIVFNCTKGSHAVEAVQSVGRENLRGKVLLDLSNPLDFSTGELRLTVCNDDSMGERVQAALPETKVVKGLNTLTAALMLNPEKLEVESNVPICGNDPKAKEQIKALLVRAGWNPERVLDLGDITGARAMEMMLPVWLRIYQTTGTPMFNWVIAK